MSILQESPAPRPISDTLPFLKHNGYARVYHPLQKQILFENFPSFATQPGSSVFGVPVGVVLDTCAVLAGSSGKLLDFHSEAMVADTIPPWTTSSRWGNIYSCSRTMTVVTHCAVLLPIGSRHALSRLVKKGPDLDPRLDDVDSSCVSDRVKGEDGQCILTGAIIALHASHLLPKSEQAWVCRSVNLNSTYNAVSLRADLCAGVLDKGYMQFVPYKGVIVALFPTSQARNLAHDYHLKEVAMPARIRRGMIFLRFVYNILHTKCSASQKVAEIVRSTLLRRSAEDDMDGGARKKAKQEGDGHDGGAEQPTRERDGPQGDGARDTQETAGETVDEGEKRDAAEDEGKTPGCEDNEESMRMRHEEALLRLYDSQEAMFTKSTVMTLDDEQCGRYPGFANMARLKFKYRREHPEIWQTTSTGLDA
ncbi:hypothetical protein B0H16DRAFT_1733389 [Mycena metata]|uniref:HNH nuclease domain-containing protein n=1 Tax=Mycena metata TaxID=1033252 RepID=A0AAD7MUH6_9AGAR|nr:hypothetical protein B0H16DRAFT_1733389 [Mycena metata]